MFQTTNHMLNDDLNTGKPAQYVADAKGAMRGGQGEVVQAYRRNL